jgi:hypothetical protein
MRGPLVTLALLGAWFVADNLPTALAAPLSLLTLAGIIASAVALAVKWVRNV